MGGSLCCLIAVIGKAPGLVPGGKAVCSGIICPVRIYQRKGESRMVTVEVKNKWQGFVAVREQFLKQAIKEGVALEIIHDNGRMVIPPEDIPKRIVRKSEYPMRDRFNKQPPGYLYYFDWKPTEAQRSLL
jgi:hypothetical protein